MEYTCNYGHTDTQTCRFIGLLCCRLHLKQPSIPVMFLTEATTPAYALAIDVRNQTVYDAVAFAKAQDFIVSIEYM